MNSIFVFLALMHCSKISLGDSLSLSLVLTPFLLRSIWRVPTALDIQQLLPNQADLLASIRGNLVLQWISEAERSHAVQHPAGPQNCGSRGCQKLHDIPARDSILCDLNHLHSKELDH